MRIRLDRTVCDGFGICAQRAPRHFSLDDWDYASLVGDGRIDPADHDSVQRALLDCPVHAITQLPEAETDAPAPASRPPGPDREPSA